MWQLGKVISTVGAMVKTMIIIKKASSSAPTLMHRAAVSGSPIDNAG